MAKAVGPELAVTFRASIGLLLASIAVAQAGGVCRRPVSLVDIYPTLLELSGLAPNPENDGLSLVPLLEDPSAPRERPAVTSRRWWNADEADHAVRSERWRYIRYRDGSEELYDHENDPGEWTNLAGDRRYRGVLAEHRRWLPRGAFEETAPPPGPVEHRGESPAPERGGKEKRRATR